MKLESLSDDQAANVIVCADALEEECRLAGMLEHAWRGTSTDARVEAGGWEKVKGFFSDKMKPFQSIRLEGKLADRPTAVVVSIAVADFGLYVGNIDFAADLRSRSPAEARIKKAFVGGWKFESTDKVLEKRLDSKPVRKALNEALRSEYKAKGTTISIQASCNLWVNTGSSSLQLRTTLGGTSRALLGGDHWFGCREYAALTDAVDSALAST